MFGGPDAQLVEDAIIIAILALIMGMGLTYSLTRLRKKKGPVSESPRAKGSLEDRVEVLERIATDRSQDLAEEIEALRTKEEAN